MHSPTINLERTKLKQALEQEQTNWKTMERSITFIEKLFVLTKGKVEWLEEQNEALIEIAQKQQMELEWLTKKIQLLQEHF